MVSAGRRWLKVTIGLVLALPLVAWLTVDRWILYLPGLLIDLRTPTGPNQPVHWRPGPDTPRNSDQPNIILIVADDLGWNDITFYGGGVAGGTVPTPHIDSIAHNGVALNQAMSASAICAPSRAALLTGRYPTRFGFEFTPLPNGMASITTRLDRSIQADFRRPLISHLDQPGIYQADFDSMGMPGSEITIAELLKTQGYKTVHIGKWHLGSTNGSEPTAQGFDESLNLAGLLYLPVDHPDAVNARQDFDPIDRFFWSVGRYSMNYNEGPRFEADGYLTDYLTREAIKVIETNRNQPFFLYLAHWAPHSPLQALKSDYDALTHIEDHTLRTYAAMIKALDRGVGEVLDALEQNGLDDNTIVIFTSDNGGAHYLGLPDINLPYRGWKTTFFGGGIRVPLFMQWPAGIEPGSQFDPFTHHTDLLPTLADMAGTSAPSDRLIDGVNLMPHLRGENPAPPHDTLFWRSGHYQVVISGGWKLQQTDRPDEVWLFHLDADPTEQDNLASQHPDKVAELQALLLQHNNELPPPMWPSVVEMPVTIDKPLGQPETPEDEHIYWPN
ncbi:Type I phosphodiesterase/nucleotide pyrophosphatase [Pseudohongiella spirulinae]|uniref:Type I phosphodiesterase/nucleotide pyrophosphatase n=1 Tax=Pseudohongiella spirulinae TaxID=1249552 RepID=A0A0S2KGI6_9GAMM|nr:Type I phosphodiesterase/nucleotide pyrophosphatase [Pseudohongiella spirulinae]